MWGSVEYHIVSLYLISCLLAASQIHVMMSQSKNGIPTVLYSDFEEHEERHVGDDRLVRERRSAQDPQLSRQANVEFIHPKLRDEMKGEEAKDPDNPWVWLTSYSRIPVSN